MSHLYDYNIYVCGTNCYGSVYVFNDNPKEEEIEQAIIDDCIKIRFFETTPQRTNIEDGKIEYEFEICAAGNNYSNGYVVVDKNASRDDIEKEILYERVIFNHYNEVSNEIITPDEPRLNEERMNLIRGGLKKGFSKEQIELLSNERISSLEAHQIYAGFNHNLPFEKVSFYGNPAYHHFNHYQMQELRLGFENGLSIEQCKLYSDPAFNSAQMMQVRLGLENGLSNTQVNVYANKDFDKNQMKQVRLGFEQGLLMEQVLSYASMHINCQEMNKIRMSFLNKKVSLDKKINNIKSLKEDNKDVNKKAEYNFER